MGRVYGNDLTDKQKAFIEQYLIDFNATQAAKRAGYQGNDNVLANVGCVNLRNPKIREHIRARLEGSCMSANEVISRLAHQARGPDDYIDEHGQVDIAQLVQDGKAHLIKSIRETRYGRTYIFYDSQRALELIGKHLQLFVDRVKHEGNITVDIHDLSDKDLADIASGSGD